jgi:hypothetical protein
MLWLGRRGERDALADIPKVGGQMVALDDDFIMPLDQSGQDWHHVTPGGGSLEVADSVLHCSIPPTPAGRYANAQIDDYDGMGRERFRWRPPLRLEVRAHTSLPVHPVDAGDGRAREGAAAPMSGFVSPRGEREPGGEDASAPQAFLRGTMGFGFWNAPMTVARGRLRLPDAIWFFGASPPSNMRLMPGMPGRGWKAQVVHAHRVGALVYGAAAVGAVAWARLTGDERAAARLVRRATATSEILLDTDASVWHDYALEWHVDEARFFVEGAEVLRASHPPHGPLGFVAWIDNQYAVATPRGQLHFGTVATGAQELVLDSVRIMPLAPRRKPD